MLPGLDRLRLPIPLGGTSNHFRTRGLRMLGGWDPFNVTEDADLGIRAAALGRTAAFTVDPIAIFYALALGTATWFIAHERFRTETFGARATVAVIVFPTVFAVLSWMFLEWRFAGAVFGTLAADPAVLTFAEGIWRALRTATTTVGAALLHVPLFVGVAVIYAVRRPVALVGYLTSVAASAVAVWVGLRYRR